MPRPLLILLGAGGVLLAVLVVVVLSLGVDPTEDSFTLTLHNDTNQVVVLKQCDVRCDSFHERDRLAPGASVPVNTSSADVANWWVVTNDSGTTSGCLDLRYKHKIENLVVNVSSQGVCPSSGRSRNTIFGIAIATLVIGVVLGAASLGTVFATRRVHERLREKGRGELPATAAAAAVALVTFGLGLWLVVDLYWLIRGSLRILRQVARPTPAYGDG